MKRSNKRMKQLLYKELKPKNVRYSRKPSITINGEMIAQTPEYVSTPLNAI